MIKIPLNFRGLFFTSGLFFILFFLHILFAKFELWFLFKLVAISIFFVSHFHSLIVFYLSRKIDFYILNQLIKISTLLSILYSTGFWYAVNDMNFNLWIFLTILFPISIHLFLIRYLFADNSKEMTNTNKYDEPYFDL